MRLLLSRAHNRLLNIILILFSLWYGKQSRRLFLLGGWRREFVWFSLRGFLRSLTVHYIQWIIVIRHDLGDVIFRALNEIVECVCALKLVQLRLFHQSSFSLILFTFEHDIYCHGIPGSFLGPWSQIFGLQGSFFILTTFQYKIT